MIRADENMTDDEFVAWQVALQYAEYHADATDTDTEAVADDAHAERLDPHADPMCRYCLGTGIVRDWVDYGSTVVPMDSTCDCVEVEDGD